MVADPDTAQKVKKTHKGERNTQTFVEKKKIRAGNKSAGGSVADPDPGLGAF
jgi:hypothetical protein